MRSFFAILKDSFREAIDQKIILVLLAMSFLLILLTASLSFEPVPADQAFTQIVKRFGVTFPEKGKSKVPLLIQGVEYSVSDVKDTGSGTYTFRLDVKPSAGEQIKNALPFLGKPSADGLRQAVVNWEKPVGKTRTVAFTPGSPPVETAQMEEADPADLAAVRDETLCAFIAHQFDVQAGLASTRVERISAGVKEPNYAFDVKVDHSGGVRGWPHTTRIFFGSVTALRESPLGLVLWIIEDQIVNGFGAFLVLLIGIIVTAFFIPNMLRKGSLDLLITRPISRVGLLVYKYIGGLTFVFVLTAVTVVGMWAVLGFRSGFWDPSFLALIPILTFTFAILYAFSTLVGVLTRSSIAAILLTCGFAFFLYVVGQIKTGLDDARADSVKGSNIPSWVVTTVDIIHGGLPRYKDLDRLSTKLISDSTLTPLEKLALAKSKAEYPDWGPTVGVSLAFIAVCLALASWRFVTRDG